MAYETVFRPKSGQKVHFGAKNRVFETSKSMPLDSGRFREGHFLDGFGREVRFLTCF